MKAIYKQSFPGECPFLIHGKAYDVEDVMDYAGEKYYLIVDESGVEDPAGYPASIFRVFEDEEDLFMDSDYTAWQYIESDDDEESPLGAAIFQHITGMSIEEILDEDED